MAVAGTVRASLAQDTRHTLVATNAGTEEMYR